MKAVFSYRRERLVSDKNVNGINLDNLIDQLLVAFDTINGSETVAFAVENVNSIK